MAEAFTALGIAANIFQFLELGFKATQTIIATYRSIDINGLAEHNADLALSASEFEDQCFRLKSDRDVAEDATLADLLTRCVDTAKRLGVEIDRIKVPESRRHQRRTKVRFAVLAYWRGNKIQGLHEDLVDIRMQICVKLQGLIYQHHRSLEKSMDSWGTASKDWNRATERRLDDMAQQINVLLESNSSSKSGGIGKLSRTLATFAEEAKSHGIIRAILESLHFTQIKERQNAIPRAHKDTFEWIFIADSEGNFSNWLQSTSGVFWVTGKPGSGKSTLMKFILGHEMTKSLAKTWAGSKPLILASHFFWYGGTKLQKSQEGFLRTLLFQILFNFPGIISDVCPDRLLGQFQYLESWSLEELSDVFERLRAIPSLPCRIFVIVDGLDEYSGQKEELAEFLLAVTRSPDIKVCCASRPWPEFRNAFGNNSRRIQMHDLTTNDMRLYVQSTLGQNKRFRKLQESQLVEAEALIDSITRKAEGVFFWVSLVVKSLLRGLGNDDGLETLKIRLSEFPPDLDQFFQRMTDSIEEVYKLDVKRIFSMLLLANSSLPLIFFKAREQLQDELKTDGRGIPDLSGVSRQTSTSIDVLQPGLLQLKDQLLSRCRDLIQAWEIADSGLPNIFSIRLGFLHRTVIEFLQRGDYQLQFDSHTDLDRYFLAESCLYFRWTYSSSKPINKDCVLWFLYILQETEVPTGGWGDFVFKIFDRCGQINKRLDDLGDDEDEIQAIERLLALSQARLLVQKHQWERKNPGHRRSLLIYTKMDDESILPSVLQGSGYIEVGDRPVATLTDSIDLELLDSLLLINRSMWHLSIDAKDILFLNVWESFIDKVQNRATRPRNAYEACQIMIKNGAPKSITTVNGKDVDLLQVLRDARAFTEDELMAMGKLFPPEGLAGQTLEDLANQTPSKKKRKRKRLHYKGKKKV